MDTSRNTLTLYTSQAQPVLDALRREGAAYSRAEYVRRKYGESAPIFLTAYSWFVSHAETFVPRPPRAEFPYWAFADLYCVDTTGNPPALRLEVPREQAVLFDMADWTKIMQLRYLGESEEAERAFRRELTLRGLDENQVMLSNFYPDWKGRILESWQRLFRHHARLQAGDCSGVASVQAGLWQLREEWIVSL